MQFRARTSGRRRLRRPIGAQNAPSGAGQHRRLGRPHREKLGMPGDTTPRALLATATTKTRSRTTHVVSNATIEGWRRKAPRMRWPVRLVSAGPTPALLRRAASVGEGLKVRARPEPAAAARSWWCTWWLWRRRGGLKGRDGDQERAVERTKPLPQQCRHCRGHST